ncbi:unnamed protein product [Dicrocoelium dendriticum]|nr:unnamed protein product [Dicrocoelium dendriticum]
MIQLVSYEPSFVDRFRNIVGFHCGILLGSLYENEERLFLPIEVSSLDSNQYNKNELHNIEDIQTQWISTQCRNLKRMMPGGVRISGICFTTTLSEFYSNQAHIRKLLLELPKCDPVLLELFGSTERELVLLLVDPAAKKFTCMTLDARSPTAVFVPVPAKERLLLHSYKSFKTHISISAETILPADRKKEEILLQLQMAVKPYLQALLADANLLINGEFREGTDKVLPAQPEVTSSIPTKAQRRTKKLPKSSKSRPMGYGGGQAVTDTDTVGVHQQPLEKRPSEGLSDDKISWADVELTVFGPQFPRWQRASSSSSLESGASSDTGYAGGTDTADSLSNNSVPINRLVVDGRIPGIAFLPSSTTVETLFGALRDDLIRSILARLELLTDELHITSAELEVPRMVLPQRVLVRLPACPTLPLSDYKFLSETAKEVVARLLYFCVPMGTRGYGDDSGIKHLFGIDPTAFSRDVLDTSCLDTSLEMSPELSGEDELSETELLENVTQTVNPVTQFMSFSNPKFWILSSAILLSAILLSYLLLGQQSYEAV